MTARCAGRPTGGLAAVARTARAWLRHGGRRAALGTPHRRRPGRLDGTIAGAPASASGKPGTRRLDRRKHPHGPAAPRPTPRTSLRSSRAHRRPPRSTRAFASGLQVALANSDGCPVTGAAGIPVTFSAPATGAERAFLRQQLEHRHGRRRRLRHRRRADVHRQRHRRQLHRHRQLAVRLRLVLADQHRRWHPGEDRRDPAEEQIGEGHSRYPPAAAGQGAGRRRQPGRRRHRHVHARLRQLPSACGAQLPPPAPASPAAAPRPPPAPARAAWPPPRRHREHGRRLVHRHRLSRAAAGAGVKAPAKPGAPTVDADQLLAHKPRRQARQAHPRRRLHAVHPCGERVPDPARRHRHRRGEEPRPGRARHVLSATAGASGRFTVHARGPHHRARVSHPAKVKVKTNACGIAVAPAFTANDAPGRLHRQGDRRARKAGCVRARQRSSRPVPVRAR